MRRRRISGGLWVWLANSAIAVAVALVAALFGLVLEDLIPVTGDPVVSWPRSLALAAGLLLLLFTLLGRGKVHRVTGTLFYVGMLAATMTDWHRKPLEVAKRHRLSLRSIIRPVDLGNSCEPADIVDDCTATAVALEIEINRDRDDTGYSLAPNLLWPAALLIGSRLPPVDRLELVELDKNGELCFPLPTTTEPYQGVLAIDHFPPDKSSTTGRIGLLIALTSAGSRITPERLFPAYGAHEYYVIRPADIPREDLAGQQYDEATLARFAACLATAVTKVTQTAGERELVVAAAMPKTVAVALGWQLGAGFFAHTYLLGFVPGSAFQQLRVHPTGPKSPVADRRLPS